MRPSRKEIAALRRWVAVHAEGCPGTEKGMRCACPAAANKKVLAALLADRREGK